jgi:hypothetical protein
MTDQVFDSMLGRDISHLIPPADGVPGISDVPAARAVASISLAPQRLALDGGEVR